MKLLASYISQRLKPLQFLVLACLLSLLIYHPTDEIAHWLNGVGFLFASFFAFRFLDDAGAVYMDRKNHPERTYLNLHNYVRYLVITALVLFSYVVILFFLEWDNLTSILLLLLITISLYGAFHKSEMGILLTPLLKYPVLLSTLVYFPGNHLPQITASFFIVLIYDLAENLHRSKSTFWWLLMMEVNCGYLLFHHLNLALFLLFLTAPIFQTLLAKFFIPSKTDFNASNLKLSGYRYLHIQLIVYYPITYFIFTYFTTL